MEMRAVEEIDIGEDLTPPLPPLAFSLYDSSLLSHCSSCFSPLSPPRLHPSFPSNPRHVPSLLYCSAQCSTADSDLHLSSAEHHLLRQYHFSGEDTSDLRAALRLLLHFEKFGIISKTDDVPTRICGLMSNRENFISHEEDDGVVARIRDGAKTMAVARRMRDGLDTDFPGDCAVEEAALCAVLTNAVEVQVNGGRDVGIAVYGTTFSWINHSCSPNACYRFSPPQFSGCESPLRIVPAAAAGGGGIELEYNGGCNKNESDSTNGCKVYGPRIICRSIKAIKNGEEVSIAYTDLLQPKALRQSELWLKYRFICCCKRCSVLPLTYVDLALQEVTAVDLDCTNPNSDKNVYRNEEIKSLTDCIEDAISEYLSLGNAESCCEKLENALAHGLIDEQSEPKEEKLQQKIRLHPLHHLSLNTYTTLASAYKIRASDLLALSPNKDEHKQYAFDMSRTSAAYLLLLAGATHHFFLSESSLIASTALSWTSVGESLLNLARSPVWNLFLKLGFPVLELSSFPSHKCCNCSLMEKFEANFVSSGAQNAEFEQISREFLNCITNTTPRVWAFLIRKCCYLGAIKDPIDFRWLQTPKSSNILDFKAHLGSSDVESSSRCKAGGFANQERMFIFRLGVHCLLYGGYLSRICWGQDSYFTCSIRSILYGVNKFVHCLS